MNDKLNIIITSHNFLTIYTSYIKNVIKLEYNIIDEYIHFILPKNIPRQIYNLLYQERYLKLEIYNNKINDNLDLLVISTLLNKKLVCKIQDSYRTYYDENNNPVYIYNKEYSDIVKYVHELTNLHFITIDYRIVLLGHNPNIIKHSKLDIWMCRKKDKISDILKSFENYKDYVYVQTQYTIISELLSSFEIPFVIHIVNSQPTYFFQLKIGKNYILGKNDVNNYKNVEHTINQIKNGYLPIVTIHIKKKIHPAILHFQSILILDTLWSKSSYLEIPLNCLEKYHNLFNMITIKDNSIEVPMKNLDDVKKFRNILHSLNDSKYKIYTGKNAIKKHISLKRSLLWNYDEETGIGSVVWYDEKDCNCDYHIKLNIKNEIDPITLESFKTLKNDEKYKIIVIEDHGYFLSSLNSISDQFALLPLSRKIIPSNINLRFQGLLPNFHKFGLITEKTILFERNNNYYINPITIVKLEEPIFIQKPFYTDYQLFQLNQDSTKTYQYNLNGELYETQTNEIISTKYINYCIIIGNLTLTLISDGEFPNLKQYFYKHYLKGDFIPFWLSSNPLSSLSLRIYLPTVTDLDSYNNYVIEWLKS